MNIEIGKYYFVNDQYSGMDPFLISKVIKIIAMPSTRGYPYVCTVENGFEKHYIYDYELSPINQPVKEQTIQTTISFNIDIYED